MTEPSIKQLAEVKLKVIMIGEMGVGKTSLVSRFLDNNFDGMYLATIGVDFRTKSWDFEGKHVKLAIWDTAGQERFKSLVPSYFRNVNGVIIVFDLGDYSSYATVKTWLAEIEKHSGKVPSLIVANKSDLPENYRSVSHSKLSHLKQNFHVPLFLTSAKTGEGVQELFHEMTRRAISHKTGEPRFRSLEKKTALRRRFSSVEDTVKLNRIKKCFVC